MNPTFQQVYDFFRSRGMFPSEEDTDDYSPEAVKDGINRGCYFKLLEEAKHLYGDSFAQFCAHMIDATDDRFYLSVDSWMQVQDIWECHWPPKS